MFTCDEKRTEAKLQSQVVTVVHYLFIMVITRHYDKIIVLTEREHLQINRTNKQAYIPHTQKLMSLSCLIKSLQENQKSSKAIWVYLD